MLLSLSGILGKMTLTATTDGLKAMVGAVQQIASIAALAASGAGAAGAGAGLAASGGAATGSSTGTDTILLRESVKSTKVASRKKITSISGII